MADEEVYVIDYDDEIYVTLVSDMSPASPLSPISATFIADGSVNNAEFQRLDGVTSNIQTQLDGKSNVGHRHLFTDLDGVAASAQIPNLDASKITTGTINVSRIPTNIPATSIADGSVDDAEFQRLNGVTSSIQSQLDTKASTIYVDAQDTSTLGAANTAAQGYAATAQTAAQNFATAADTVVASNASAALTSGLANLNASNIVTGILVAPRGGTGLSSYVIGDLLYASATNALSALAGNTTTTRQFLSSTGTGSAAQAPAWAALTGADITSGTVPPARLGSGTPTSTTLLDGSGAWRPLTGSDIPQHSAALLNSGTLDVARLNGGTSAQFVRADGTNSNTLTGPLQVNDGVSGTGLHVFFPATSLGSDTGSAILFGGGTSNFTGNRGGMVLAYGVNHATEACNVVLRPGLGGVAKITQPNTSAVGLQVDANGTTLTNSPTLIGNSTSKIMVRPGTSSGADNQYAILYGGGTSNETGSRGGSVVAYGANHATRANQVRLSSGTGGNVELAVGNSTRLSLDATNSHVLLSGWPINLGSSATVPAGSNSVTGTSLGATMNSATGLSNRIQVAGVTNSNFGAAFGTVGASRFAIGQYAVGTAVATQPGIGSDGTQVYHNVPTGGGHSIRVNNAVVGLFQSSLITFSAPIALGNAYTVTPGSNQIVGTANGVQINAPTGSTVAISTNGTTRASFGINGLVFASGATTAAPGNISIGSGAGATMSLNVPSGGLYLFGENGTSGVVIAAASQYLQFQGQGGILGAAGNAGHCYIAGGNVAANSSCAYIRVYGVSASSNAGQAVYACGNVAGAKHSFVDGSGTERLTIDETALTALGPLVTPAATPASATAAGVAGQWAWDASYIYICTSTNTWRRVAHNTW